MTRARWRHKARGAAGGQEHRSPLRRTRDGVLELHQLARRPWLRGVRNEGGAQGSGEEDGRAARRRMLRRLHRPRSGVQGNVQHGGCIHDRGCIGQARCIYRRARSLHGSAIGGACMELHAQQGLVRVRGFGLVAGRRQRPSRGVVLYLWAAERAPARLLLRRQPTLAGRLALRRVVHLRM